MPYTAALSMVYWTTEYCCLVWGKSAHTHLFELHQSMHYINQFTPIAWLPALTNIPPLNIRKLATVQECNKILNQDPPSKPDVIHPPRLRHRSNPSPKISIQLMSGMVIGTIHKKTFIIDVTIKVTGFQLLYLTCGKLNCNEFLFKWNMVPSPS